MVVYYSFGKHRGPRTAREQGQNAQHPEIDVSFRHTNS